MVSLGIHYWDCQFLTTVYIPDSRRDRGNLDTQVCQPLSVIIWPWWPSRKLGVVWCTPQACCAGIGCLKRGILCSTEYFRAAGCFTISICIVSIMLLMILLLAKEVDIERLILGIAQLAIMGLMSFPNPHAEQCLHNVLHQWAWLRRPLVRTLQIVAENHNPTVCLTKANAALTMRGSFTAYQKMPRSPLLPIVWT